MAQRRCTSYNAYQAEVPAAVLAFALSIGFASPAAFVRWVKGMIEEEGLPRCEIPIRSGS